VNKEDSAHNEVDGIKKGVDSTGEVFFGKRTTKHKANYIAERGATIPCGSLR